MSLVPNSQENRLLVAAYSNGIIYLSINATAYLSYLGLVSNNNRNYSGVQYNPADATRFLAVAQYTG
jgi:hypothetical protein